jgi:tetratricopeptide (TPR) repeat protein
MGLAVAAVWCIMATGDSIGSGLTPRWRRAACYGIWFAMSCACIIVTEQTLPLWRTSQALFGTVIELDPQNHLALTHAGRHYASHGDYATAEACLNKALVACVDYPPTIQSMAIFYAMTGRREEALATRDWVSRMDTAGEYLDEVDRIPQIQEWLRERAAERPRSTVASTPATPVQLRFQEGVAAARRQDFRQALAAFQAAVEVDPLFAAAHNNLGMSAIELGDRQLALQAFQRAVELKPEKADYAVNLVRTLMLLKRFDEALPLCEKAATLAPQDPEVRGLLVDLRRRSRPKP